jgi:hypothetical protein
MNRVICVRGKAEFSNEYSVPTEPRRGCAAKLRPNIVCLGSKGGSSRIIAIAVVTILSAISRCASVTVCLISTDCHEDSEGVDVLGCTCSGIANERIVRVLPVSLDHLRASIRIFFTELVSVTGFRYGGTQVHCSVLPISCCPLLKADSVCCVQV